MRSPFVGSRPPISPASLLSRASSADSPHLVRSFFLYFFPLCRLPFFPAFCVFFSPLPWAFLFFFGCLFWDLWSSFEAGKSFGTEVGIFCVSLCARALSFFPRIGFEDLGRSREVGGGGRDREGVGNLVLVLGFRVCGQKCGWERKGRRAESDNDYSGGHHDQR